VFSLPDFQSSIEVAPNLPAFCYNETITCGVEKTMVEIGDILLVSGGYDYDPKWLKGREGCIGTVVRFLWEGNDRRGKLVLDLGEDFHTCEFSGRYLVLFQRCKGSAWEDKGVVHVVVGNSIPSDVKSIGVASDPRDGFKWVEAAASYRVISQKARRNVRFTETG